MDETESLNHRKRKCKYHVVFIPKCRGKTLYKELRRYLGEVLRRLAEQKESRVEGTCGRFAGQKRETLRAGGRKAEQPSPLDIDQKILYI